MPDLGEFLRYISLSEIKIRYIPSLDSPVSEFCVLTFQNTLFQLYRWCKQNEDIIPKLRRDIVYTILEMHFFSFMRLV